MMTLDDPVLKISAEILDDLETVRVANENRLRQLTRTETDADGEDRGFGLPEDDPAVRQLAALVADLKAAEHRATLALAKRMRAHPLGPWMKAQRGVGDKQGARLLAAIGDPYIRPELVAADGTIEEPRPRMVSELWAYGGYHVVDIPGGQETTDAQRERATGDPTSVRQPLLDTQERFADGSTSPSGQRPTDTQRIVAAGGTDGDHPGQPVPDTHTCFAGVAPFHQHGQRSNWNDNVRMRAHLIAAKCVMQPDGTTWRDVYTAGRAKYADAVHRTRCKRCGPKGKPAAVGSPLSDGHKHARAVRLVAKEILKELWREAGRLHGADTRPPGGDHRSDDTHTDAVTDPGLSEAS